MASLREQTAAREELEALVASANAEPDVGIESNKRIRLIMHELIRVIKEIACQDKEGKRVPVSIRTLLPFAKKFEGCITASADKFLKEISDASANVGRSSFFNDRAKREAVLRKIVAFTAPFHKYILLLRLLFDNNFSGKIPFADIETLLAPMDCPFSKLVPFIEAALPTEQDIADMKAGQDSKTLPKSELNQGIPKISPLENHFYSRILNDLNAMVNNACIAQGAPCMLEHLKKLLENPRKFVPIVNAQRVVAKGLFLSESSPGAVFQIYPSSANDYDSIWSNFACPINNILFFGLQIFGGNFRPIYYEFYASRDILVVLFKVTKIWLENAASADVNDAATMKTLHEGIAKFNICTSSFFGDSELFESSAGEETLKYLASDEIQSDVFDTCFALYKLATKKSGFSPDLRMQICWNAINLLSIYGSAYMFHHGSESYLSSVVLQKVTCMAKCWSSFMEYFSSHSLLYSERMMWERQNLYLMALWPGIFEASIVRTSDKEIEPPVAVQHQIPTSRCLTVFSKHLEIRTTLEAVESLCQMGSTLPFFLTFPDPDPRAIGRFVMEDAATVVKILLYKTSKVLSQRQNHDFMSYSPQFITTILSAVKMAVALINVPEAVLKEGNESEKQVQDRKMDMIAGILQAVHIFQFNTAQFYPPNFEKENAAMSLVLIHALQCLPEAAIFRPAFFLHLGHTILSVSSTLSSIVLPSDVLGGLERVLALAERGYEDALKASKIGGLAAFLEERPGQIEALKGLIEEAKKASPTDVERCLKRAEVLAVLPCAFVGCTSFPSPGKDTLSSKKCSNCKIVTYCSVQCQKKDWKVHKLACTAAADKKVYFTS